LWASIATNATVSNNRFNGYKDLGGSDENAAGITVYGCSNLIVENNEFYNNVTGIYLKGTTGGIRITGLLLRKNLFYNNAGAGIFTVAVGDPYSTLPVNKIYQNIIWGSGYFGIRANQWTRNTYFINNTVAGSLGMFLASNPEEGAFFSVYVHNNISHSNTVGFSLGTVTNASLLNINNNLISNYSVYGSFSGVNYDDISFKSATGYQSNSSTRNPLFLNYAERDFRLQAGSPALTLGVDILNLTDGGTSARIPAGAYITGNEVIGIGQLDSPSAPRSLRILN
jgi:parallel beta-helix repeat protein